MRVTCIPNSFNRLDYFNTILWQVQITELFIMHVSPVSYYLYRVQTHAISVFLLRLQSKYNSHVSTILILYSLEIMFSDGRHEEHKYLYYK